MNLLQSAALLRSYFLLPHRLLNHGFAQLCVQKKPRWAVDAAVRLWARRAHIDLAEFEDRRFDSIEDFFLRRLRPGARPLGPGFVSPVDGHLVAAGPLDAATTLHIKGRPMSLSRVVNGVRAGQPLHALPLESYRGGHYAVIFLSPRGYHRIHMPTAGVIKAWQWIPGRFFPQNDRALQRIARVYERNERVVLRAELPRGPEFLMVLVGASLVGGIHVEGVDIERLQSGAGLLRGEPDLEWARSCKLPRKKGEELGHFRFGSTIVLLFPRGFGQPLTMLLGTEIKMGETLYPEGTAGEK